MSDSTTIARPYAKAIFSHALDNKNLSTWSAILLNLTQAMLLPDVESFIGNPDTTLESKCQLLSAIFDKVNLASEKKIVESLVHLLAENKRLQVLPAIYAQYEALRAAQEKTLTATVHSFTALTSTEQQNLIQSLSKRLQRQVTLEISIDESLLGGAIIQAGDLVIDGSVRGMLVKLGTNLAA
jgi:F-type H+-transporting ATPase subunit delta